MYKYLFSSYYYCLANIIYKIHMYMICYHEYRIYVFLFQIQRIAD